MPSPLRRVFLLALLAAAFFPHASFAQAPGDDDLSVSSDLSESMTILTEALQDLRQNNPDLMAGPHPAPWLAHALQTPIESYHQAAAAVGEAKARIVLELPENATSSRLTNDALRDAIQRWHNGIQAQAASQVDAVAAAAVPLAGVALEDIVDAHMPAFSVVVRERAMIKAIAGIASEGEVTVLPSLLAWMGDMEAQRALWTTRPAAYPSVPEGETVLTLKPLLGYQANVSFLDDAGGYAREAKRLAGWHLGLKNGFGSLMFTVLGEAQFVEQDALARAAIRGDDLVANVVAMSASFKAEVSSTMLAHALEVASLSLPNGTSDAGQAARALGMLSAVHLLRPLPINSAAPTEATDAYGATAGGPASGWTALVVLAAVGVVRLRSRPSC